MENPEGDAPNGTEWGGTLPAKGADFQKALASKLDPGASKEEQVTHRDRSHEHHNHPGEQRTPRWVLPGPHKSHREITASDEESSPEHLSRLPHRRAHDEGPIGGEASRPVDSHRSLIRA